jgi:hypothetical protein
MSLETKIEELTAAVNALVAVLQQKPAAPAPVPTPAATPVAAAPAPVVAAPPAPVPVSPSNPVMPPPPVFEAPAPAPAAPTAKAPFTDQKTLITYVMESYKQLGPVKGAQIQQVLGSLGVQNINEVKAEQHDAFFAGVEALKG